jgi:[ribosomal protein S18]-alanine N-acetyltransferase
MNIRPATLADIRAMIQLERQSAGASHWTEGHYRLLFRTDGGGTSRLILVIEESLTSDDAEFKSGGEARPLLGFLVARQIPPEWELENIAVEASKRRTGLGTKLLEYLIAEAWLTRTQSVFLEVRESNQPARAFYEKAGFRPTGRRPSYYSDPAEDAIVYQMSLAGTHPTSISK